MDALNGGAPACVSVFAGRLADFGIDYAPLMRDSIAQARATPNVEIIWASTREAYNVVEADQMGCHIITAPADVLKKLPAHGHQNRRGIVARCGEGLPRGRAVGRVVAQPAGQGCRRIGGRGRRIGPKRLRDSSKRAGKMPNLSASAIRNALT